MGNRTLTLKRLLSYAYEWLRESIAGVAGVAAPFATGLAAIALGLASSSVPELRNFRTLFLVVGIVAAVVGIAAGVAVELSRRSAKRRVLSEAVEYQIALTAAIHPILVRLRQLAESSHPDNPQLERVISAVLRARAIVFPNSESLRMVVFKYDPPMRRRKACLKWVDHDGRPRSQPSDFVAGDNGRGDAAIAWLRTKTTKFVADTRDEADPNWKGSGDGYRTFISAPVPVGESRGTTG